jgi:hypothetical protein
MRAKHSALAMSMALACGVFGQSATVFSYPSGSPVDCTIPTGFSMEALCSVSNQLPLGSSVPAWETGWTDRNLGGGMRLLSSANALHSYSTISPFSTNDKHVIASLGASGMTVYDRETRAVLYANRPGSVHGVYWAAWSDGVYYFLSGAKLMKHTLATAATEVVICGGGYAWPSKGFGSATSCAVAKREVHVRSLLVNASSSALTFLSTVLSGEITTIASLRVSMSVNSGADRSASMTVAGTQVTVNQDMACPVELQTPTLRIPAAGGSAMVRVLSACAWRIAQSDTWLSAMRASETVHI